MIAKKRKPRRSKLSVAGLELMIQNHVDAYCTNASFVAKQFSVMESRITNIESDVRYACSQIKAVVERQVQLQKQLAAVVEEIGKELRDLKSEKAFGGKYIGEQWVPQSGDPAVDVIRRVARMLTDYADSRYGREKL
jgi:hypothetical protein